MTNQATTHKQQSLNSQALNLLRFPLAIFVITIHLFARQNRVPDIGNTHLSIYDYFCSFLEAFIHNQSVPIYFFISGFVFFIGLQEWDNQKFGKKLNNRIKSLLIPYLIWNTITIIGYIVQNHGKCSDFSITNFLSSYWSYNGWIDGSNGYTMPISYPLWFLRDLMVMVIFSPVIHFVLKKQGKVTIIILGILWYITTCVKNLHFYCPKEAIFFFSFGAYMSINGKDMIREFRNHFKITAILFISLGIIHMILYNSQYTQITKYIKPAIIFFGLFFAYNISSYLLEKGYSKNNNFLSSASFFMYVSHTIFLSVFYPLTMKLLQPSSDLTLLLTSILILGITISILLIVYYLMSRYMPKTFSFITGRKN